MSMKRVFIFLLVSLTIAGAPAFANQPNGSVISKRQLNGCMVKRMGSNKALSYNDAMRICKEQLQPGKESLAAINQVEPAVKVR
jgi:hypothetical protein